MVNFYKPKKNKVQANNPIALAIASLDLNGAGVGRYNGKPVFVEGCLPGEEVKVKLVEQKSKYARGQLLAIEKASPMRVEPKCPHFKVCGGCDLQHMPLAEQLNYKRQKITELFSRNANLTELPWHEPIVGDEFGYRRKARIGVQYNKHHQATIGFRHKRSNQLTAIKQCMVLVPSLDSLITPLTTLVSSFSTKSAIGHIDLIAPDKSARVYLQFRLVRKLNSNDLALIEDFKKTHAVDVELSYSKEVKQGKGDPIAALNAPLHYQLEVNGKVFGFDFDSRDFIQVNSNVNQAMVNKALEWLSVSDDDIVLDLFSGLGNFSLPVAAKAKSVIGIEGVQAMVDKANANAGQNQIKNCHFFQADLNSDWQKQPWLDNLAQVNKIILDPARAGALEAVSQFHLMKAKRIVYVSCDPATLARDTKVLLAQGYHLSKILLMDMFAQTRHIETMVCFEKD